jgi:hypothetical protein
VFAGGSHPSFEMAAKALGKLAEVKVSDRQLGRITEEIGTEMTRQRDLKTTRHQEKTLPVAVAGIPSLVVVEIDGGRYLARDPAAGTGPGAHGVGWKEDKAACLVTMTGAAFDHDPHPDLPTCFTDKKSVAKLVKGLTSQGSLSELTDTSGGDETPELTVFAATDTPTTPPEWPPKPLVRTSIATTRDCDALGPMVAAEAHARNFDRAPRKVFLGDGGKWIWGIQKTYFSKYTAVVDFVHVLSYIYLAAKAVCTSSDEHWETYLRWASACWQGNVETVITELTRWRDHLGPILDDEKLPKTDPRKVVATTLGYVENNRSRMNYAQYRREGLPTMSGLVESLIKQFNYRVKGTEKSWRQKNAESILQVRAAVLSEDERFEKHMGNRECPQFRRYEKTCENTKPKKSKKTG